jgi:hypothetical protein
VLTTDDEALVSEDTINAAFSFELKVLVDHHLVDIDYIDIFLLSDYHHITWMTLDLFHLDCFGNKHILLRHHDTPAIVSVPEP